MEIKFFKRKGLILPTINILSLVFFLWLLGSILGRGLWFNLDHVVNNLVPSIRMAFFTPLFVAMSYVFEPVNLVILTVVVCICFFVPEIHSRTTKSWWDAVFQINQKRKSAIFFFCTVALGSVILMGIKDIIQRARPIEMFIPDNSFSFPSGHATLAVLFFGVIIYFVIKKMKSKSAKYSLAALLIIVILLVGFSRIYLQEHWMSDVLAGFSLGVFVVTSSVIILHRIKGRHFKNLHNLKK